MKFRLIILSAFFLVSCRDHLSTCMIDIVVMGSPNGDMAVRFTNNSAVDICIPDSVLDARFQTLSLYEDKKIVALHDIVEPWSEREALRRQSYKILPRNWFQVFYVNLEAFGKLDGEFTYDLVGDYFSCTDLVRSASPKRYVFRRHGKIDL